MQLHGQAELAGGFEYLCRFFQRKGDVFAKDIHRIGQADHCGQHFLADEAEIARAVFLIFGRQGMRAEEGGGDIDGAGLTQLAGGF